MAHLLAVDADQRLPVVFRRRRINQIFLLLHGSELGVALINNQVHQSIADRLIGDLRDSLPFGLALVVAELDIGGMQLAELRFKIIAGEQLRVVADVFLPLLEIFDPVFKSRNFDHGSPFAPYSNDRSNFNLTFAAQQINP